MCNVGRILSVGMLITPTLLSLAAPLKLPFPVVGLQISPLPNFALKFRNELSMRYLRYQICTLMFYNQSLFFIALILSWGTTLSTIISHSRPPLLAIYAILSLTTPTHLINYILSIFTKANRVSSCRFLFILLHTYLFDYLLTPWSRVLLKKLTSLQLIKKFPAFYEIRRFIMAVTSARQLSLSWASLIQSIPPHPTSWRPILILSSHLRLVLPSGLFPSGFLIKTIHTPLLSPIRTTCPVSLILLDFITRTKLVQIIKLLILQFSALPSYLVPLRSKYSPQ